MKFDYQKDWANIDCRKNKEKYQIGRGEQGVLLIEPYKSELLPLWRFKTPNIAKKSAKELYQKYEQYKKDDDFPGMDMARKFMQMGYTRASRYANHKSGKKYKGPVPSDKKGRSGSHGRDELPKEEDSEKRQSALIFKEKWEEIKEDKDYQRMKEEFKNKYN